MKKKVWFITAGSLVLAGCIMFTVALWAVKWDFSKLSTVRYETNTYEIGKKFGSISISADTADIRFVLSGDKKCTVECREEENAKHSVEVENDTLVIKSNDSKTWYDYIGIYFGSPKITVYLPETEYGALSVHAATGSVKIPEDFTFTAADISLSTGNADFRANVTETAKIQTATGNISVENTSVGALDISASTGKVTVSNAVCRENISVKVFTGKVSLTDVSCQNVLSDGTTGEIFLNNVIAAEKISIERSMGDVNFVGCDAAELDIKTSTGNVIGSVLTEKVFIADTDTGNIDIPETSSGGKCKIKTGTGSIRITVEN